MTALGKGQGLHVMGGRTLAMARALAAKHEPTAAEILLARRMNHEGADIREIRAALGWDCHLETVRNRFRKLGLRLRGRIEGRSHLGEDTGCACPNGVDQRAFRPKPIEAA
jgi:hypothetical protein